MLKSCINGNPAGQAGGETIECHQSGSCRLSNLLSSPLATSKANFLYDVKILC